MTLAQAVPLRNHRSELKNEDGRRRSERRIGQYSLGKTIGKGTFGRVRLGTHTLTGSKVAIKVLEKSKMTNAADVARLAREIGILKLLTHPNIVKLFEVFDTPRHIYLVTEYAAGGEVFDYIVAHRRLREPEAARLFRQILSAVAYCHALGVIHRDIKPENLLLDERRRIKVIDFGLANTIRGGRLLDTACGSPSYAAPEMIAGESYAGPAADIWSCGVVLFALVVGRLPFEDSSTQGLYKKIMSATYTAPLHLSAGCKDLLARLLTPDPAQRITATGVFAHPWMAGAGCGQPTHPIPRTLLTKPDAPAATARTVRSPSRADETVAIDVPSATELCLPPPVIDQDCLSRCVELGLDADEVSAALTTRRHNNFTATYYLLLADAEQNKCSAERARREASEADAARLAERARLLAEGCSPISPRAAAGAQPQRRGTPPASRGRLATPSPRAPPGPMLPSVAVSPRRGSGSGSDTFSLPPLPESVPHVGRHAAPASSRRRSMPGRPDPLPQLGPLTSPFPAAAANVANRRASLAIDAHTRADAAAAHIRFAGGVSPPASARYSSSSEASPRTPTQLLGSAFSAAQTSMLPPTTVLQRVARAFVATGLATRQDPDELYLLRGHGRGVALEAQVCRLQGLDGVVVVRLARISGEPFAYKRVTHELTSSWNIN